MTLRIFTEPQQGASYDDLLAVAGTSEELGFDAFFRSDHYLRMGRGDGSPGPSDAWGTLAALVRDTSRHPPRHPRLTGHVSPAGGHQRGHLDASGGRIEPGLGTGWFDDEHTADGIPFPPLGQRFEMLEEQLEIVTGPCPICPNTSPIQQTTVPKPGQSAPARRIGEVFGVSWRRHEDSVASPARLAVSGTSPGRRGSSISAVTVPWSSSQRTTFTTVA